jgi:hypothetical protein
MFSPDQWAASTGVAFYNGVATQSLRFDSSDSAYLSLSPAPSGDSRKKFTFSCWVKRCAVGTEHVLFSAGANASSATGIVYFYFSSSDTLAWYRQFSGSADTHYITSAKYRDTSAWYHVVLVEDANTTSHKIYVNGVEQAYATTTAGTNTNSAVGSTEIHTIGRRSWTASSYLNGYMAEVNFLDNIAVGETDGYLDEFGELKNGVWIPKEYTGSYGTNGFRLQFNQTGTGTPSSSTIGADTSGNDNHFISSGIVASDCDMPDSPENNFATFNGVDTRFRSELAEGNLNLRATTYSSGNFGHSICTFPIPSSGKWYIEAYGLNITGNNTTSIGIMDRNVVSTSATQVNYSITTDEGFDGIRQGHYSSPFMRIIVDGTQSGSDISFTNQSAISALAIDVDNGYIYVGGNDGTGGTGSEITWRDYADGSTGSSNVDPTSGSSGTGGIARTFTNNDIIVCDVSVSGDNSSKSQVYLNAGQDSSFAGNLTAQGNSDANGIGDFYYQVPDGYLALCTANLPEPTISPNADEQADSYFNTVLYTGTGASGNAITGVGFQPDWLWIKRRNGATSHRLIDSSRGSGFYLQSNTTGAEASTSGIFTSFDSDGFTVEGTANATNGSGNTYVAWNWKANGGTTSSNTTGDITSTVQASADSGFSMVLYSGNGSNPSTVGHSLGKKPDLLIVKSRDDADNWLVGSDTISGWNWYSDYLHLQATSAKMTDANGTGFNSAPTSTVFSVGAYLNGSSENYIAYLFTSIDGYSKIGTYIGNGSTDGTFVYTGFRPAFIITKRSDGANRWVIEDAVRDTYNQVEKYLSASENNAEATSSSRAFDFLSNGFKARGTDPDINNSGGNYIYMAFAENPFKYANAR